MSMELKKKARNKKEGMSVQEVQDTLDEAARAGLTPENSRVRANVSPMGKVQEVIVTEEE